MSSMKPNNTEPDLLLQVIDAQKMQHAIELIRDVGHFNHAIYHLAFRTNSKTDLPFFVSTYPMAWLGQYMKNNYADIDPVILDGFHRDKPFFWSDLEIKSDQHETFFEDAFEHGIGKTGFSIPLTDRSQRKALFSVTSEMEDDDWRKKIKHEQTILEQIGNILHRKAVREVYGSEETTPLSPRETECLFWTAQGKDGPTVSDILGISEHTVRDYLKSARYKLGCTTIAQAIHEATKRRLISF